MLFPLSVRKASTSAHHSSKQPSSSTHTSYNHYEDDSDCSQEYGEERRRRAPPTHRALLSGFQEVPPVKTDARGKFVGLVDAQGTRDEEGYRPLVLKFKLFVFDLDQITQAHIHLGEEGENGPVVAFLFGLVPPTGEVNGLLSEGTLTNADLVGPLQGKTIRQLLRLIDEGKAYVNVHTVPYPDGELRGQLEYL